VALEEINARRRDRRCLRCGRSGCRIAVCPLAAAIRLLYTTIRAALSTLVPDAAIKDTKEVKAD
jgi:hypothetical protein